MDTETEQADEEEEDGVAFDPLLVALLLEEPEATVTLTVVGHAELALLLVLTAVVLTTGVLELGWLIFSTMTEQFVLLLVVTFTTDTIGTVLLAFHPVVGWPHEPNGVAETELVRYTVVGSTLAVHGSKKGHSSSVWSVTMGVGGFIA